MHVFQIAVLAYSWLFFLFLCYCAIIPDLALWDVVVLDLEMIRLIQPLLLDKHSIVYISNGRYIQAIS